MADHTIDINGTDPSATYGLFFKDGTYQELLKLPTRKPGLQQDWPDEDGIEVDGAANNYDSRPLALPVAMWADSEEALLLKYQGFGAMVLDGDPIVLDAHFLNRRYTLRYVGVSGVVWDGSLVTFTLNLMDDYPTDLTPIPAP